MIEYYAALFTLELEHDYYADKVCRGLSVVPTRTCRRRLLDHGLLFRASPGGALVVVEQRNTGEPRVQIREDTVFTFTLRIRDPHFLAITDADLAEMDVRHAYVFGNEAGQSETSDDTTRQITLHEGPLAETVLVVRPAFRLPVDPAVSAAVVRDPAGDLVRREPITADADYVRIDLTGTEEGEYTVALEDQGGVELATERVFLTSEPAPVGLFGFVQVRFSADVLSAAKEHAFRLQFDARKVQWIYRVHVDEAESNPVEDLNLNPDAIALESALIKFSKSVQGQSPTDLPNDIEFASNGGIELREEPYVAIQLLAESEGAVLIENMPNPRPDRLERDGATGFRVEMPLTIR